MSQLTTFDDMPLEAIEVACQSAFEECESVFRAIDAKKNQLEIFGRLLTAAKKKVPHGEWENWLIDTFQGRLKLRTAQLWMSKAQKVALLDSPEKTEIPRTERKTGCVKVASPVEPVSNTDEFDENAVPPEPKTNTRYSKATAKSKEADRPAPPVVTPDIVEEPEPSDPIQEWIETHTLADLVTLVLAKTSSEDDDAARKKAAKQLRKMADQLDPPSIGAPSIEAVEAWAADHGYRDFDADKFFNHYELAGWKYGKAKTPIKDWKRAAANAYAGGKGWAVNGANRLPF